MHHVRSVATAALLAASLEALGGAYAAAEGLHETCEAIRRTWLEPLSWEREVARQLKVRLPRAFAGYDPDRAVLAAAIDAPRFEQAFGLTPDTLDEATALALERQLRDCAMVGSENARTALRQAFYPNGELRATSR